MTIKENSRVTYTGNNRGYLIGRVGTVESFNGSRTSALVHFPKNDSHPPVYEWIGVLALKEAPVTAYVDTINALKDQHDEAAKRIHVIDKELLKLQHERDELYNKKAKTSSAIRALEAV